MDATIAKAIALIVLFVTTLVLGIIPYFIIQKGVKGTVSSARERILCILNCFAGGVFLGTCLLHLFVEGKEDLDDVLERSYNFTEYPVFETLVGSGLFLIAFVEQAVLCCMTGAVVTTSSTKTKKSVSATVESNENPVFNIDDNENVSPDIHRCPSQSSELEKQISHTREFETIAHASGMRAFVLVIALSFHTIFDGLAIGLQTTDTHTWEVFAAISVHKCLVAFCLGLQLFRAFQPRFWKSFGCLLLFAIMSPIGIGVGIAVTSLHLDTDAQQLASGVLQGIACGTFLYVTFFEILRDDLAHKSNVLKVLVAVIGFAAMAAVKALDKD